MAFARKIVSEVDSKDLNLSDELFTFTETFRVHKADVVLIEPCLLWTVLTNNFKQILIKRKYVAEEGIECKRTENGDRILYTFAISSSAVNIVLVANQSSLQSGLAERGFDISLKFDELDKRLNHAFFSLNDITIHLVVVHKRPNYFLIKPLVGLNDTVTTRELQFGQTSQAFDKFHVTSYATQGYKILLVEKVSYFLMELKFSQFIDCDRTLAKKVKFDAPVPPLNWWPALELARKDMSSKLNESFKLIKMLEKQLLIPLWLDGGTLLGWNRQCSVINYDHDIDVATFLHYNDNSWNLTTDMRDLIVSMSDSKSWSLAETYGFPWNAYQLRIWNFATRWGVDIFFADYDSDNDRYLFGYHPYPNERYCLLKYPKAAFDRICTTEFEGFKMFVPCQPELVHLAEYGDDWATPNKTYKINNGFCSDYWMPDELPFAYQCLAMSTTDDLNVLNATSYSSSERSKSQSSKPFTKLASRYFTLCQVIKMYRNV